MENEILFCDKCNSKLNFRVVQSHKNMGRKWAKCCDKFFWADSNNYDLDKFKRGTCYRCGCYNCEVTDCNKTFDWFGNKIPTNDVILEKLEGMQ